MQKQGGWPAVALTLAALPGADKVAKKVVKTTGKGLKRELKTVTRNVPHAASIPKYANAVRALMLAPKIARKSSRFLRAAKTGGKAMGISAAIGAPLGYLETRRVLNAQEQKRPNVNG
jgi:transcription initiation factor TFIIIB Brf1 subunit/transcription initiation factor TFIIB